MLDIDKSTVDFLVTENMVQEVEKVPAMTFRWCTPSWKRW